MSRYGPAAIVGAILLTIVSAIPLTPVGAISLTRVGAICSVGAIALTRVGAILVTKRTCTDLAAVTIRARVKITTARPPAIVLCSRLAGVIRLPVSGLVLSLVFLLQAPGSGWVVVQAPPREVRRVYWELFQTTEVWVRITPSDPDGGAPLVSLVFQAFFPGRAQREWYSLRPQWPKGAPARLVVRAEPFPLTAVRELSLRFVINDFTFDLTGPGSRYTILPCGVGADDCTPNALEAELDPALLRLLTAARTVRGQALGLPVQLAGADQRALGEFAARVGVSGKEATNR